MMEFIADVLLIAGAAAAAFYCIVLSRRLKRFNDLEKGVGGAIAVLSSQVDDMTKTLNSAQAAANGSNDSLELLTGRAEGVAKRLEILVASMHDLPVSSEASEIEGGKDSTSGPTGNNESADSEVAASSFKSARINSSQAAA